MVVTFVDLTEVNAFGFIIRDFESIFHGPQWQIKAERPPASVEPPSGGRAVSFVPDV